VLADAPADARDAARVAMIADAVSERVENETSRSFVTRTLTETRNGNGKRAMRLRMFPVIAMTSLSVTDTPGGTPHALVLNTDYDLDARKGEVRLRAGVFTRGFQNVSAGYSAGFGAQDSATLPADIYQAALDYVKFTYQRLSSDAVVASSINIGPSSVMVLPGIPKDIQRVIDQWGVVRL
jgi:hypothetical protein